MKDRQPSNTNADYNGQAVILDWPLTLASDDRARCLSQEDQEPIPFRLMVSPSCRPPMIRASGPILFVEDLRSGGSSGSAVGYQVRGPGFEFQSGPNQIMICSSVSTQH
ncbi:hypothetical protein PoB_006871200 [Plakobranchus ocellatus]|uniref:Uncharacterized protein n=1 Tax=Plakobranchus ocellatus TaxID=259542 RepID=A0AAV4DD74_9GAST|nr:hypothetical protein PoB_006871200 [Plakobranchus ocellatus]